MSKFKIGDRVSVVIKSGDDFDNVNIGDMGIVVNIIEGIKYPVRLNINNQKDYGFEEEELKLLDYKEYIGIYDLPHVEFESYKILAKDKEDAEGVFKNKLMEQGHIHKDWKDVDEFVTIIPLWDLEVII